MNPDMSSVYTPYTKLFTEIHFFAKEL